MHIKGHSVINAIPLAESLAFLILRALACNRVPVSPSKFWYSTGEATAIKPDRFSQARLDKHRHQDRVTLLAHKEEAARTPPQDMRASWQMSDKHNLKPMQHNLNYYIESLWSWLRPTPGYRQVHGHRLKRRLLNRYWIVRICVSVTMQSLCSHKAHSVVCRNLHVGALVTQPAAEELYLAEMGPFSIL